MRSVRASQSASSIKNGSCRFALAPTLDREREQRAVNAAAREEPSHAPGIVGEVLDHEVAPARVNPLDSQASTRRK